MDKLTRLTLLNQFRILHHLDPHGGHDESVTILEHGYEYFYDELTGWIDDEVSADDCTFVMDVLEMYADIGHATASPSSALYNDGHTFFPGFDGNNEGPLLGFAKFALGPRGLFTSIKVASPGLNSHTSMRKIYEVRLERWRQLGTRAPTDQQILDVTT